MKSNRHLNSDFILNKKKKKYMLRHCSRVIRYNQDFWNKDGIKEAK